MTGVLELPALLTPRAPGRATCAYPTAETPPPGSSHSASPFLRVPSARSGRVPRQSLDAPENLPKQALRQVALHKLEDEVPGMSDAAPPVFQPCRAASSKVSEHQVLRCLNSIVPWFIVPPHPSRVTSHHRRRSRVRWDLRSTNRRQRPPGGQRRLREPIAGPRLDGRQPPFPEGGSSPSSERRAQPCASRSPQTRLPPPPAHEAGGGAGRGSNNF
jgi:hypothetical protein